MDTRIGYPNEHLAGNSSEVISSPLYATAVGLVMNSIANNTQSAYKLELRDTFKEVKPVAQPIAEVEEPAVVEHHVEEKKAKDNESTGDKIKRSFFDKYVDKIKDFLDNAE